MQMDNTSEDPPALPEQTVKTPEPGNSADEIKKIRDDFQSRLIVASLQTEAVRAGMIDLDGLKLANLSDAKLGPDDKVVGGRQIIDDLRRNKPWLFTTSSTSSVAEAPPSKPIRQKTALEMTEEEYVAARAAVTRQSF
jgi:hypothetical protein